MTWYAGARPVAIGLLAAAVLAAGCTSSKSGNTAATGAASASAASEASATSQPVSPTASGSVRPTPAVSGDPAAVKLYQQAVASLSKIDTVHVKGTGSEGGSTYALDLSIAKGKGATGTVGIGNGTIHLVQVADAMYLQLDADTLKVLGGAAGASVPDSMRNALKDKWLKVPTSMTGGSPLADFAQLDDLSSLAGDFAPQGALSIKDRKQIDGKAAVGLLGIGSSGSDGSVLYIEDGGDHLPLQYVPGGQGQFDFIDYGKPVTITAPPSSDVVDFSQLQQLVAPTATSR
jgi:hypothetical protein